MKKVGSHHAYHRGRGGLVVHNATTCSNDPSIGLDVVVHNATTCSNNPSILIEEFHRFNLKKLELRIEFSGLVAFRFVCCVSDPSGVGFPKTLRSWEPKDYFLG